MINAAKLQKNSTQMTQIKQIYADFLCYICVNPSNLRYLRAILHTQLFHLYRIHRIITCHAPILESYRCGGNDSNKHKRKQINPPIHRRFVGKIFQPAGNGIPCQRRRYHKANDQYFEIRLVEHDDFD